MSENENTWPYGASWDNPAEQRTQKNIFPSDLEWYLWKLYKIRFCDTEAEEDMPPVPVYEDKWGKWGLTYQSAMCLCHMLYNGVETYGTLQEAIPWFDISAGMRNLQAGGWAVRHRCNGDPSMDKCGATREGIKAILKGVLVGQKMEVSFNELMDIIDKGLDSIERHGVIKGYKPDSRSYSVTTRFDGRIPLIRGFAHSMTALMDDNMSLPFCSSLIALNYDEWSPVAKILALAITRHFRKNFTEPFNEDVLKLGYEENDFSEEIGKLVKEGFVEEVQKKMYEHTVTGYILSKKACRKLFGEHEEIIRYEKVTDVLSVTKADSIIPKEIFYNEDDRDAVDTVFGICEGDNAERYLRALRGQKLRTSLGILLYGPPGIGKTELAKQAAQRSGRDLLFMSADKINGPYVGESENLTRDLFRQLAYLEILSKKRPILFIDEADGILGQRVQSERSTDAMHNNIQNMILQELEAFDGVFIASTNTTANMDPAFDSRIVMKVELHIPDEKTREKILSSKIPDMGSSAAKALAQEFPLTGRQIENVAIWRIGQKCIKNKVPSLDEMRDFCRSECEVSKRNHKDSRFQEGQRIGF